MSEEPDERREMNRRELDEIHKSIKYLNACALKSSDFRGQARVVGIIASLIFIGSFMYTFNHKTDAHSDFDRVERSIIKLDLKNERIHQSMESRMDKLETTSEVSADRYDRLIRDITNLNERVTRLINMLVEDPPIRRYNPIHSMPNNGRNNPQYDTYNNGD